MAFRVSASVPINAKNGRRSMATLATGFVGAMLVIAVVMQPSDSSARAELSADIAQGSWARDHSADPSELSPPNAVNYLQYTAMRQHPRAAAVAPAQAPVAAWVCVRVRVC